MTLRERLGYTMDIYKLSQDAVARNVVGRDGKAVSRNYINMLIHDTGNVNASDETLIKILNIIYALGERKIKENLTNKQL